MNRSPTRAALIVENRDLCLRNGHSVLSSSRDQTYASQFPVKICQRSE